MLDMVRSMMVQENLSISYWGDALLTLTYVLNRVPLKSITSTLYELWNNCKLDLNNLRPWESMVYVHNPSKRYGKLGLRERIERACVHR